MIPSLGHAYLEEYLAAHFWVPENIIIIFLNIQSLFKFNIDTECVHSCIEITYKSKMVYQLDIVLSGNGIAYNNLKWESEILPWQQKHIGMYSHTVLYLLSGGAYS